MPHSRKKPRHFIKISKSSLAGLAFLVFAIPSASAWYGCEKPADPNGFEFWHKGYGQWSPLHNTNNWTYRVVTGRDYYQKKSNPSKKVYLACTESMNPSPFAQAAEYRIDARGNQDGCGQTITIPAERYTPTCEVSSGVFNPQFGFCFQNGNLAEDIAENLHAAVPMDEADFISGYTPSTGGFIPNKVPYCPRGGQFIYLEKTPLKAITAELVDAPTDRHLSCGPGERYYRKNVGAPGGSEAVPPMTEFILPSDASTLYFTARIKPGASDPHLRYTDRLVLAYDRNYYSTSNPQGGVYLDKHFGITRNAFGNTNAPALIFRRWEKQSVLDYVTIGYRIDAPQQSPDATGAQSYLRAEFIDGAQTTSTDRDFYALEWCAPMKAIEGGSLAVSGPAELTLAKPGGQPEISETATKLEPPIRPARPAKPETVEKRSK